MRAADIEPGQIIVIPVTNGSVRAKVYSIEQGQQSHLMPENCRAFVEDRPALGLNINLGRAVEVIGLGIRISRMTYWTLPDDEFEIADQ